MLTSWAIAISIPLAAGFWGYAIGVAHCIYNDTRAKRREEVQRIAWQADFRRLLRERQQLREQERALRRQGYIL